MGINPVTVFEPTVGTQLADASRRQQTSATPRETSVQPDLGASPKQESRPDGSAAASLEIPQDEVQVQQDRETNGEIVIRYLDHFGNLIVQVPSSQMLGVTRAIDQDFQAQAKVRESEAATSESNRGGDHGN